MAKGLCGLIPSLFGLALVLESATAFADTLSGYYGGQQLVERSAEYEVTVRPGWAKIGVRREVFNGGSVIDEAIFTIRHPSDSAAIGLRTKSSTLGAPWWQGKLLDAQVAEERYRRLTGRGTAVPRDPALLYWISPDTLGLQVFPCAVKKSQWVEYTLLFPTSFENGKTLLDSSHLGVVASANAKVTVKPEDPRNWLIVNGVEYRPGATANLQHVGLDTIELVSSDAPLRTRYASIGMNSARSIDRLTLEAAPRISSVPKNAYIVVLLDNSFSMEKENELSELYRPLVTAYLSHFSGAKTKISLFDRKVSDITQGFESVGNAVEKLARWLKQLRNGSDLDSALKQVQQSFQSAPRGAPRRLLIVTDSLTRSALDERRIAKLMNATGALVHLTSIERGHPNLNESREHVFQAAVSVTGGLTWKAAVPAESEIDNLTRVNEVFEEWARPRYYRLDRIRVGARDVVVQEQELRLDEGQQWTDEALREGGPHPLFIHARLWSTPVRLVVPSNQIEETLGAAFVTTQAGNYDDLTDAELKELAYRGGAVTPLTSYLAIEPGVRPSTAGIERVERGVGIGLGSLGHGGGVGSGRAYDSLGPFNPDGWLRDRLLELRNACAADALVVRLTLETTRDEIVDLLSLESTPKTPLAEACIRDALWDTQLPYAFSQWERNEWELTVP